MSGPPPWTTTGLIPTYLSSTTSRANSSRSAGSSIAAPPYLMTTVLPWNSRMYGSASRRVATSRTVSGRVVGIDRHVAVGQVREEDLGLVPLPRKADHVLDLRAGDALGEGREVEGPGRAARADRDALDRDVDFEGRGVGERAADGLRDPPPVGIAPVEGRLDERRVRDAARRSLDGDAVAAGHDDAADPLGALAVADDLERELAQEGVEGLAEGELVRRLGVDPHAARAAGHQQDRVVRRELAVDADAVERALDRHAEQEVGGLGGERGVGLHEAEHRREARLDHAGALGLRAEPDGGTARQRDVDGRALLERVGGHDRGGEVALAVGPQPAGGARQPGHDRLRVERHADHPGRGDRDALVRDARRDRRGALHLRRVVEAAPAGGGVRVAGVDGDGAQAVELRALLRDDDRRREDARAGEARGARRVGRVADEQADVGVPRRLQARRDAGGAEALRQAAVGRLADALGHLDPARAEEAGADGHCRPAVSSSPNIRLRFCTACDEDPFQRLSIAAKTKTLPVRSSMRAAIRQMFVSRTSRTPGGRSTTSTNGSWA